MLKNNLFFFGDIMEKFVYKVGKPFTGMLDGKETVFKHGDIISFNEVESWKNKDNLLSCRFIIKVVDEKPKTKREEVFS